MLLKYQKGILNCWREYFCELLNPVTVQHLETSKEQIDEKVYPIEAEVSTTIKSLKAGKAFVEDDIRLEMLKAMNFDFRWLINVFQLSSLKKQARYRSKDRPMFLYLFTKKKTRKSALTTGAFFVKYSWKGLCQVP